MGHEATQPRVTKAAFALLATSLLVLSLAPNALAGGPFHTRNKALDVSGLNHACGVAVDSKGDLYLSSAGESKVKVFNSSHVLLTEIADANTPCGLAVTTTGALYVSEQATGNVVRFKPSEYPFLGTPTYGSPEPIDSSTHAKGIAVDRNDNRLYVAEGTKVAVYGSTGSFETNVGEGTLTEATGVAPYTYLFGLNTERYLWVADANGADHLDLFRGAEPTAMTMRRELKGETTPDGSFGFGPSGAYLAQDPGNRNSEKKCVAIGGQACSAGDLFLYDAGHEALDEFDGSGEYLDQVKNAAFADAEPSAVAIDRSGGSNDGTIYVTAGKEAGAKALAFKPLAAPSRKVLKQPEEEPGGLSHNLNGAWSVATDSHGDAYVTALGSTKVHVYGPSGAQIVEFEDSHKPKGIAVDSTGKVYVMDENNGFNGELEVTYYTPSNYPPEASTTYARRPSPIVKEPEFPAGNPLRAIAVNPGPGPGKDQLLVAGGGTTRRYDSAANGSTQLDAEFAQCSTVSGGPHISIAVNGTSGTTYIGANGNVIWMVNEAGTKCLGRFDDKGSPSGKVGVNTNPMLAVDQSNGHVIVFDEAKGAREYDAAGSFLAEFGSFTEGLGLSYGVAVDSSCALHEPEPLTEATTPTCHAYDPANGTAYVAFADTSSTHPPYKGLNAFGPLEYTSEPSKHKLTVERKGTGSGTVTGGSAEEPGTIACGSTCSHEYPETAVVELVATLGPSAEFQAWEGCENPEPTQADCKVTPSADRTVKATFKAKVGVEYPLTAKKTGTGEATLTSTPEGIDCAPGCEEETAEFVEGSEVRLKAEVEQGSELLGWRAGDCEAETVSVHEGTCTVTMDEAKEAQAQIGEEHPLLSVSEEGGGEGTVTSTPAGISCEPTCAHKFELDQAVTLKANAAPDSLFTGWSGCDAEPSAEECEVQMGEARQVKATFIALPRALAELPLIAYHEATLQGEVDPAGRATEYHFEYLSEAEYEAAGETFAGAHKTPVGELAASSGLLAVQAPITGLTEGTAYRFRLLVENSAGSAADEGSFETLRRRAPESCPNAEYRFGLSANLPDCRAYELVTPAQTNGLIPRAETDGGSSSGSFSNWFTPQRGEGAGERLSYFTDGTLPGFEGNGILDAYRAQRGAGDHPAGGWQSALFSPDYLQSAPTILNPAPQHGVAADQLYSIWESAPKGETFPETLPEGVYLRTPTGFEAIGQGSLGVDLEALSRYLSPGGAHVIFASKEHLEAKAAPKGTEALYDRAAGSPSAEVISVKPDGTPFGGGEGASYLGATEDGSAVAFGVGGTLYLHHGGKTTEVATGFHLFAGISEDGKRVFYESAGALYACDAEAGPCAGPGAHLPAKIANNGIFALVSPDGSHAFFSSEEALTGAEENENQEHAEAGKRNLYAWDGAQTRFVGQLLASDFTGFAGVGEMNLAAWTTSLGLGDHGGRAYAPTRSTQGGGAFVFQSHAQLSEYDNEGVGEIYRYEPSAEAGGQLLCVSCDPSGAPPSADALLEDLGDNSPARPKTMIANLTDNGNEVFFQSFDRLLPEDANEVEDVYEWRAKGTEGPGGDVCQRTGGCLALISSGQGEVPSTLYAMSGDGHDVFFRTQEKLVGMDVPGSPSLYDARVGGGIPEPSPPAPCQGDACQGVGTLPPALPNPASTGGGEGEGEASSPPSSCAKGKHRVKGRCVASKRHKRHAKKHRKASSKRGTGK